MVMDKPLLSGPKDHKLVNYYRMDTNEDKYDPKDIKNILSGIQIII